VALRQEEFTRLCDDVDLDRDRILVERCQAGDSGAFGSLYARYYERLLRFCLRRLHDRHEAEDAAQEAFARAWKALPNFAGERRFYPWLTVIAGNICTDMLRRRARSTPTEDVELGARPPVGAITAATADEMIIAADERELAHQALGRLSVRHRHVLAMREDSGWTYQQIADHEGVETGTIETLLWRARQAFKREFLALSESKGPLAGFLLGVGATIRTVMVRSAHRVAALQSGGNGASGGGAFRAAFAGVAVTTAAVAAAFVAPHAFDSSQHARVTLPAPAPAPTATAAATAGAKGAGLSLASVTPGAGNAGSSGSSAGSAGARSTPSISPAAATAEGSISPGSGTVSVSGAASVTGTVSVSGAATGSIPVTGSIPGAASLPEGLLSEASKSTAAVMGLAAPLSGAVSGALAASPLKSLVPATAGVVATTAEGLGSAVGSGSATTQLGSSLSSPAVSSAIGSTTTTAAPTTVSGIEATASSLISALHLLGQGQG
jgi:RNA polymerase sigma-70 factor (ECF subfamily)